jgi:histidyl-tRNA synthetase
MEEAVREEATLMLTQKPRGTADLLPGEVEQWQRLEQTFREVSERYHFAEIRTPIFEHTELFERGVGETTDIVSKEMYTFLDRGNRSVTLRPEGTAGVVRAYVENKLYGTTGVSKLFYIGPMFRYEKPQKGRWRQFHQYGCEALGSDAPELDAEIIAYGWDFLTTLGIQNVTAEVNSVGCPVCRPRHKEEMLQRLKPVADRLCKDCQSRLDRNPLRIFDCKHDSCQALLREVNAPVILDCLCDECRQHFEAVKTTLDAMAIPYVVNERLVRGLDYYTRTAWEFTVPGFSTVAAGGRYNRLVAEVGGPETPGVGFAGGIERALLVLSEQGAQAASEQRLDAFVAVAEAVASTPAVRLLHRLRQAGVRADRDYQDKGLKAQFKLADRYKARFVLILGSSELESGVVSVKDLDSGEQVSVPDSEIVEYIQTRVKRA